MTLSISLLIGSSQAMRGKLHQPGEALLRTEELIATAVKLLHPHRSQGRLFGDVAAALRTTTGSVFVGVCVDTPSWGLCAERSAIAAMITAGEYKIHKIVAVWRNDAGAVSVLPPCGVCREFMHNVDVANLEADVVLSPTSSVKLKALLPHHEWPVTASSHRSVLGDFIPIARDKG